MPKWPPNRSFHLATDADIKSGQVHDIYFGRTVEILRHRGFMEIDGKAMAKRGKRSGSKQVYRCRACFRSAVVPAHKLMERCDCGGSVEPLLKPLIIQGKVVRDLPPPRTIREHVLEQLRRVELHSSQGGERRHPDY